MDIIGSSVNAVATEGGNPGAFIVEIRTVLGTDAVMFGEQFADVIADQHGVLSSIAELAHIAYIRPGSMDAAMSVAVLEGTSSFYHDYSVLEYFMLMGEDPSDWHIGDQGVTIVPVHDEDNQIASYLLTNWIVTEQSDMYVQVLRGIPEPATVSLVMLGLIPVLQRRLRLNSNSPTRLSTPSDAGSGISVTLR